MRREFNVRTGDSTSKSLSFYSLFSYTFLPIGYPQSVKKDYLEFQIYDSIQGACSYLRSILTTTAIFKGMGVGDSNASLLSATYTWVLKDLTSMLGSLLFSSMASNQFNQNIRAWRLFADVINDVGLTLDMIAPLYPSR